MLVFPQRIIRQPCHVCSQDPSFLNSSEGAKVKSEIADIHCCQANQSQRLLSVTRRAIVLHQLNVFYYVKIFIDCIEIAVLLLLLLLMHFHHKSFKSYSPLAINLYLINNGL